ncbi:MAG: hypothetical protein JW795_10500 [Chitinivibrionales bacterium]|nr:hypothetical protein [Chitinivibrionales bacterium]
MKKSPSEKEFEKNLLPSKFSAEGFMGTDPRSLEEIIADDTATLQRLNLTVVEIAATLKKILQKAKEGLGNEVILSPQIKAQFFESMGRIPSPFRGDGLFEKGEAQVTHIPSSKTLIITSLSINLIEKHLFFQGRGSRYRLEPGELKPFLSIHEVL